MTLETAIELINEAIKIEEARAKFEATHKNYEMMKDTSYSKRKHDDLLRMARNILADNYYERHK